VIDAATGSDGGARPPRLAYVIGTYPSLTTTFIDRELDRLRRWDVPVQVISLRRPGHALSAGQRAMQPDVRYVLPVRPSALVMSHVRFLTRAPRTYLGTLGHLLSRPHPSQCARGRTFLHFAMAVHVAAMLADGPEVEHVHAHFVDRAAIVALVVGRLLGLPFSATAHANDIYVDPVLLPEKLAAARFVATCTRFNAAHLAGLPGAEDARIVCVHHGIDLVDYQPADVADTVVPALLCVAQLRPKKGLVDLVDACAALRDRGHVFTCTIVGDGPQRAELDARIRSHDLGGVVVLAGALPHPAVLEHLRRAAVFVLPCVTAPDGDRDGIPNAILEAMAMQVPVISTRHSGIPEAVEDGITGRLVEPHDVAGLTDAIATLLDDPEGRRRLGMLARERILASFDLDANVRRLLQEFSSREVADVR
jgi:glycosyltransferase involved in cell wall biosynthesis